MRRLSVVIVLTASQWLLQEFIGFVDIHKVAENLKLYPVVPDNRWGLRCVREIRVLSGSSLRCSRFPLLRTWVLHHLGKAYSKTIETRFRPLYCSSVQGQLRSRRTKKLGVDVAQLSAIQREIFEVGNLRKGRNYTRQDLTRLTK